MRLECTDVQIPWDKWGRDAVALELEIPIDSIHFSTAIHGARVLAIRVFLTARRNTVASTHLILVRGEALVCHYWVGMELRGGPYSKMDGVTCSRAMIGGVRGTYAL